MIKPTKKNGVFNGSQSYEILRDYYVDEDEDANWFEMQLDLVEKIGVQNWLVQQL